MDATRPPAKRRPAAPPGSVELPGAPESGGAAGGPRGAAAWAAQTTVDGTAPNGELGYAIAVTKDGSAVAVGAPDRPVPTVAGATGGVYVYVRTGSTWTSTTGDDPLFDGSSATASGPDYGAAVDIVKVGDVIHLAVGSPQLNGGAFQWPHHRGGH